MCIFFLSFRGQLRDLLFLIERTGHCCVFSVGEICGAATYDSLCELGTPLKNKTQNISYRARHQKKRSSHISPYQQPYRWANSVIKPATRIMIKETTFIRYSTSSPTARVPLPVELVIELGQVADHSQFVGGGAGCHFLAGHHRADPELRASHVKRQLAVLSRVQ